MFDEEMLLPVSGEITVGGKLSTKPTYEVSDSWSDDDNFKAFTKWYAVVRSGTTHAQGSHREAVNPVFCQTGTVNA